MLGLSNVQILEDLFIKQEKERLPGLTYETEIIMRYSFSVGVRRAGAIAYKEGTGDQKRAVLTALGAAPEVEYDEGA